MRHLYTAVLYLALPIVLLRLWWRGRRSPAYRQRWSERLGAFPGPQLRGSVWIHAVSVGETIAATPLISRLAARYPKHPLVITTTTPTGSERVRATFGQTVHHSYLPYDLPGPLARFFDRVEPSVLVIMETEIWPNLFRACSRRKVPLILANARLSPRSFLGFQRVRGLVARTLADVHLIAAQSRADADRFVALGAPADRVRVMGNLKYDLSVKAEDIEAGGALRQALGSDRRVIVAVSTHQGEDGLILDAFDRVRAEMPDTALILVPRHPERFDEVGALCEERDFETVRRSLGEPTSKCDVLLGDSMGEMMRYLAAGDVAVVAGSFQSVGGHNVLEPAALGLPVVFGPHMFNFEAAAAEVLASGAGRQVADAGSLAAAVLEFFQNDAARRRAGKAGLAMVETNRGALEGLSDAVATALSEQNHTKPERS